MLCWPWYIETHSVLLHVCIEPNRTHMTRSIQTSSKQIHHLNQTWRFKHSINIIDHSLFTLLRRSVTYFTFITICRLGSFKYFNCLFRTADLIRTVWKWSTKDDRRSFGVTEGSRSSIQCVVYQNKLNLWVEWKEQWKCRVDIPLDVRFLW